MLLSHALMLISYSSYHKHNCVSDTKILFYGRLKVGTKIMNQISRFMKDMKVLLVDKVYVVNVLGTYLSFSPPCFTYHILYVNFFGSWLLLDKIK